MKDLIDKIDLQTVISLLILIIGDGGIIGLRKIFKGGKGGTRRDPKGGTRRDPFPDNYSDGEKPKNKSSTKSTAFSPFMIIMVILNLTLIVVALYPKFRTIIEPPIFEYELKSDDTLCITGINNKNLSELKVPNEYDDKIVSEIADNAFAGSNAFDIEIPDSVQTIGDYAFEGCNNLTSITVDDNNIAYSSSHGILFNETKTKLICYPVGKKLGQPIISGECGPELKWHFYDSGVLWISGNGSMDEYENADLQPWAEYRNNITSIVFDGYVTEIGKTAFTYCGNLKYAILPESVSEIRDFAFKQCSSMEEIIIPDSVVIIKMGAFEKCENMKKVVLGKSVRELDRSFLCDCRKTQSITVSAENSFFTCIDGALYDKEVTELVLCPKGISGKYTIPDTVRVIGNYACQFSDYSEIVLPPSLESFGFASMSWCNNMKSINMPLSVSKIGKWAFRGDYNLTDIYYDGTEQDWQKIQIDSSGMNEAINAALKNATIHFNGEQQ